MADTQAKLGNAAMQLRLERRCVRGAQLPQESPARLQHPIYTHTPTSHEQMHIYSNTCTCTVSTHIFTHEYKHIYKHMCVHN